MKPRLAVNLLFAVSALATAFTMTSAQAQTSEAPSVLRVVPTQDLVAFDPVVASNPQGSSYAVMVYDMLFAFDEQFVAQPQMVDNYTVSDDRMTYTFTLREGQKWHDGQPVTAEDCVASINRWGSKDGMGRILLSRTESIEVIDEKTFQLKLKEPFSFVIDALARSNNVGAFMMPKRFAETDASTPITEAIGSGPYKLAKDEWVPGVKIVFVKNEDYVPRQEEPSGLAGAKIGYFDRVEWNLIKDPATALSALQQGEIDIWETPPPELLSVVRASPDLATSVVNPLGRLMNLRPNFLHPPFDDVRARVALQYLTDQNEYMMAAVGDPEAFMTCTALLYCGGPLETHVGAERLQAENDPEKAAALFRETGWDFSKPITILQATDAPEYTATALVLADKLRSIGLNPRLVSMDLATMQVATRKRSTPEEGGYNIFATYNSPGNGVNPLTGNITFANCDGAYAGWPCNEELERLRLSLGVAPSIEDRRKIIEEWQKIAYDFGLFVPVGQVKTTVAHRADIEGILQTGDVNAYYNIRRKED
ncbi:ABC transporter substrate-binding protein [Pseudochelatococcus sp. B33]